MSNQKFVLLVNELEEHPFESPEFIRTVHKLSWHLKFDPEIRFEGKKPDIRDLFRMSWILWKKSPNRIKPKIIFTAIRSTFKKILLKMS